MKLSPLRIEQMWSEAIKQAADSGFFDVFLFARAVETATYRAGAEAMRERAAQLLELEYAPDKKASDRLKQIAGHIRALNA